MSALLKANEELAYQLEEKAELLRQTFFPPPALQFFAFCAVPAKGIGVRFSGAGLSRRKCPLTGGNCYCFNRWPQQCSLPGWPDYAAMTLEDSILASELTDSERGLDRARWYHKC